MLAVGAEPQADDGVMRVALGLEHASVAVPQVDPAGFGAGGDDVAVPRVHRQRPNIRAVAVEHHVRSVLVVNLPNIAPVRAHHDIGRVQVAVQSANRGRSVAVVGV